MESRQFKNGDKVVLKQSRVRSIRENYSGPGWEVEKKRLADFMCDGGIGIVECYVSMNVVRIISPDFDSYLQLNESNFELTMESPTEEDMLDMF